MNVTFCHVECEMSERLKSAYHFMISGKIASIAVYQSDVCPLRVAFTGAVYYGHNCLDYFD